MAKTKIKPVIHYGLVNVMGRNGKVKGVPFFAEMSEEEAGKCQASMSCLTTAIPMSALDKLLDEK